MPIDFLTLKIKVEKAEQRLKKDKEKLKSICEHKNLKGQRGYIDYQSYYRDYIDGWVQCVDCGYYVSEDSNKEDYYKRKYKYE